MGEIIIKRIIVAITGASGVQYGIRCLEVLNQLSLETHLIISKAGCMNIEIETDYKIDEIKSMASVCYEDYLMVSSVASGSFLTEGMIIIPCTIKTLSGIANSYNENLILRAADVTLKEKRKLVLVVRETPLHKGHLKLMVQATDNGATILPPMPAFYHRPKSISDILDQTVGRVLDQLGIEHQLFQRWGTKELNN